MSTPSRKKGSAFERDVVTVLRAEGFPSAERAPLWGSADCGDITGTPGICWQVRNTKRMELAGAVDDAQKQAANSGADYGIAVVKRKGAGNAADAYAVLPLADMCRLLKEAGR